MLLIYKKKKKQKKRWLDLRHFQQNRFDDFMPQQFKGILKISTINFPEKDTIDFTRNVKEILKTSVDIEIEKTYFKARKQINNF